MSFSDAQSSNPLRGKVSINREIPRNVSANRSIQFAKSYSGVSNVSFESKNDIRLAEYQEPNELEKLDPINKDSSELQRQPESASLPPLSEVRAPISWNPFANIRQNDSNGLLYEPQSYRANPTAATYSELTGRESRHLLAGFNAHRFHHNPLYFEEPNLERYGNELEFQRAVSGAKFLTNAALLPCRLMNHPACSRVSTLGHKRPGEFVPYREYPKYGVLFGASHPFHANQNQSGHPRRHH